MVFVLLRLIHLPVVLQQGQVHELVNIQTRINVDLEAGLDERANLLVNGLPLRLAEVEDGFLLRDHLQRDPADNERVQDGTRAPHVCLVCYHGVAAMVEDFRCQVDLVHSAHLVFETQMGRYIYQLHYGYMRDS